MQLQSLRFLRKIVKEEMHLQVKVIQNVAQFSLHHVTCAATKFKVARSIVLLRIFYQITLFNSATIAYRRLILSLCPGFLLSLEVLLNLV